MPRRRTLLSQFPFFDLRSGLLLVCKKPSAFSEAHRPHQRNLPDFFLTNGRFSASRQNAVNGPLGTDGSDAAYNFTRKAQIA